MTEIAKVNFGKDTREIVRKFMRLVGIVEKYEQDVLKNHLPWLRKGSEEITSYRQGIEKTLNGGRGK